MAIGEIRRMIGVGIPPETAKVIDEAVGTGGLQIGTTGTTAMAGNKVPTLTERGGALLQAAVADCTVAADGTSAGTQLNLLLAALRTAGIITA